MRKVMHPPPIESDWHPVSPCNHHATSGSLSCQRFCFVRLVLVPKPSYYYCDRCPSMAHRLVHQSLCDGQHCLLLKAGRKVANHHHDMSFIVMYCREGSQPQGMPSCATAQLLNETMTTKVIRANGDHQAWHLLQSRPDRGGGFGKGML
jgi:hypothetical protein